METFEWNLEFVVTRDVDPEVAKSEASEERRRIGFWLLESELIAFYVKRGLARAQGCQHYR